MPLVPTYDNRQVKDAGAPNQYQSAQGAGPAAFGALEGQALVGLGGDLNKAATSMDNIAQRMAQADSAATAMRLQTEAGDKRRDFYYGENGVFNTQGGDALGVTEKVKKFEGDLFQQQVSKISDPVLKEKYSQIYERSRTSYLDTSARHEAGQRTKYNQESATATVNTAGLNAVNAWDKPEVFNQEIATIKQSIAAANVGAPAQEIEFKTRVAVSGVYKNATLMQLEKDPSAAKTYYDANKDNIEAADRLALEKAFEAPMQKQRLEQTSKELFGTGGTQGGKLIKAVVGSESGGNPNAQSPVGAAGLMQVMPGTAREIDTALGGIYGLGGMSDAQVQNFYKQNPGVNLLHGSYYLQQQLNKYGGDVEAALVAYNAGPANADKFVKARLDGNPDPYSVLPKRSETEPYVKKTLTRYAEELGGPTETKSTLRDMPNLPPPGQKIASGQMFPPNSFYMPDEVFKGRPGAYVDARALTMANELGRRFEELTGRRVEMNSGFRDPGTNDRVGGAKQSRHMHGDAFDFNIKDLPDEEKTAFLSLARQVGFQGIGFYEGGPGHIHLDIGKARSWGATPEWAKGATQETASTGYIGQSSMSVGYGNLPMPANMAMRASGITQPAEAPAAAGMFPVTAGFAPGSLLNAPGLSDTATAPSSPTEPPPPPLVPAPVSTKVDPDDFDPDDLRARAMAAAEADPANGPALLRRAEAFIAGKERSRKSALREVANEGWAHVIQGGAVDEMPAQVLRALMEKDPETVKKMQEFEDRRETRKDKTDEATYYQLSQMTPEQLKDPDFNLMDYAPKLSAADLKHFAQQQADARRAGRNLVTDSAIMGPKEAGNMALAGIGIKTTGNDADPVRAGMFFQRFQQEITAYTERTGKKPPPEDVDKIAKLLTAPVTQSGMFGGSVKYRFEMGTADENEARQANNLPAIGGDTGVFDGAKELKDVPMDAITSIADGYKKSHNDATAQPKPAELVDIYNRAMTAATGRPVPVPDEHAAPFKAKIAAAIGRAPSDAELATYYSRWLRRTYPLNIGK